MQAVQSQVRIDGFDKLRFLADERRLASGSDDARAGAEFLFHSRDDAVHQRYVTVEKAARMLAVVELPITFAGFCISIRGSFAACS